MALVKGTNSYATVAEADVHFEDRLDVAAWHDADDDEKGQALMTGTSILEYMDWTGVVVSETQNLAFPRVGSYFDPRLGMQVAFDSTETPNRIILATYELAHHFLNNDGLLDQTGRVRNLTVGSIVLHKIEAPAKIPANVDRLIKPLLVNAGANLWWRAN